jgi:hypothetical protein
MAIRLTDIFPNSSAVMFRTNLPGFPTCRITNYTHCRFEAHFTKEGEIRLISKGRLPFQTDLSNRAHEISLLEEEHQITVTYTVTIGMNRLPRNRNQ